MGPKELLKQPSAYSGQRMLAQGDQYKQVQDNYY